jgi:hypothetical protein
MIQLPSELLNRIFSHLDFRDKLQSALTCRKWRDPTVLYSKMCFIHQSEFRKMVKFTSGHSEKKAQNSNH